MKHVLRSPGDEVRAALMCLGVGAAGVGADVISVFLLQGSTSHASGGGSAISPFTSLKEQNILYQQLIGDITEVCVQP